MPRKVFVPIGPSIAYVPLTQGQWALIDREDAEWAGSRSWCAHWKSGIKSFYAVRDHGRIAMHRLIINATSPVVDHINQNSLDNRRCNLRPTTHAINRLNTKVHPRKGVYLANYGNYGDRWHAAIGVNGKSKNLGTFDTFEEAHMAYLAARDAMLRAA